MLGRIECRATYIYCVGELHYRVDACAVFTHQDIVLHIIHDMQVGICIMQFGDHSHSKLVSCGMLLLDEQSDFMW